MPIYDEYTIGYKDHSAVFDSADLGKLTHPHTLVIDGQVLGTWKRTLTRNKVLVEVDSFHPLKSAETRSLATSVRQYGQFLNLPAQLA
jgi:Winged helix DNA-binding domain